MYIYIYIIHMITYELSPVSPLNVTTIYRSSSLINGPQVFHQWHPLMAGLRRRPRLRRQPIPDMT